MVLVEFVYEKIHAYLLLYKLYQNYQIYRNSSGAKRAAAKYLPLGKTAPTTLKRVQDGLSRFKKNIQEGPGRSMSVLKDALVLSALHNRNVRSLPNAV